MESGPVETAHAPFSSSEHLAGIANATRAGFRLLGGCDPVDPVSAGTGRDVGPHRAGRRKGRERFAQVCRNPWFRFQSAVNR
jgi:hypothetical protein